MPERVRACAIASDKYAARRLGRLEVVADDAWVDIGTLLISSGLAFAYDGGKRGDAWCTCLKSGTCPAGYPPSAK